VAPTGTICRPGWPCGDAEQFVGKAVADVGDAAEVEFGAAEPLQPRRHAAGQRARLERAAVAVGQQQRSGTTVRSKP
jgi:hypothetical protein